MTFLDCLNSPKCDFRQNPSGGKIIKYLQSQALTSQFESFWSIVVRIEKYFQLEMSSKWQKSPYLAKMITQQLKDKNLKRNAVVSNEVFEANFWLLHLILLAGIIRQQTIDASLIESRDGYLRSSTQNYYQRSKITVDNFSKKVGRNVLLGYLQNWAIFL